LRNQLNWFLSPGFLDYKISDFDLLRIATMICFLNKNKVQENLDEHVLNHKKISVNLIEIENYRNDSYLLPVYNLAIELKKSNIKYLLVTSYEPKNSHKKIINLDIPDGEFREIDVLEPPFSLPKPKIKILDKDEQSKTSGFNCYLYLYTKGQIESLVI